MSKLRVEGFSSLVRDTDSNAIVNVNKSEYQLYMSTLKQELFEIKKLLKEIKN